MSSWKERLVLASTIALSAWPPLRAEIAWKAEQQTRVMRVMAVLPGRADGTPYSYAQVEAACQASQIGPDSVRECLLAQHSCLAMERFYAALGER